MHVVRPALASGQDGVRSQSARAGGKVGSLPQSERIIDNEAYTVAIT
ncbi:hypothetical protein [Actinoplanes sp. NPDC026670]